LAKCTSNEKQIAIAYMLYADDHDGFLPVSGTEVPVGSGWVAPSRWFLKISRYIGNKSGHYADLVSSNKVVACPSARLDADVIPKSVSGYQCYGGYGHNYAYLGWTQADHQKLSRILKPVKTSSTWGS